MATLPCSQAVHTSTAPKSLLPGIDALLAATISWSVLTPASEASWAFILSSKKTAAIGPELLQEIVLVARAAGFAEMRGAVDVRRQLVGDELRHLSVVVPVGRRRQRLLEFRLVGVLQLRILEDVLAVVQGEHIAV